MADPPRKPLNVPPNWNVQGTTIAPPDAARTLRAEEWKLGGGPAGNTGSSMNKLDWLRDKGSYDYLQLHDDPTVDPTLLDAFREMLLRRGL